MESRVSSLVPVAGRSLQQPLIPQSAGLCPKSFKRGLQLDPVARAWTGLPLGADGSESGRRRSLILVDDGPESCAADIPAALSGPAIYLRASLKGWRRSADSTLSRPAGCEPDETRIFVNNLTHTFIKPHVEATVEAPAVLIGPLAVVSVDGNGAISLDGHGARSLDNLASTLRCVGIHEFQKPYLDLAVVKFLAHQASLGS